MKNVTAPELSPALAVLVREGLTGIDVGVDWSADPVWAIGSASVVGMLDLDQLGLSAQLIDALRGWSHEWEEAVSQHDEMRWPSIRARRAWSARGLTLAYDLQQEIGDRVDVLYSGDGPRSTPPVRQGRGR